jgi:uncharacterized protein (TIGR04255 family)
VATPRSLSRAPITEALVDIRALVGTSFNPTRLLEAKQLLKAAFPVSKDQKSAQVAIKAGQDLSSTTTDLGLRGVFLYSQDEREVVQFRVDGFTYNRLRPYTSWEEILPRSLEAWGTFVSLTEPTAVTRVAVRYINHIPVRGTSRDALRALHGRVTLPLDLPGETRGYAFRAQLAHPDGFTHANLVQAVEPGLDQDSVSVLLDIDVYRSTENLPMSAEALRIEFAALREYKNQIFFSSLTDATAQDLT